MCIENITLWEFIEKLGHQLSLPHKNLDTLIPQPLNNYDDNEYVKFYRSSGFSIGADVKVTQLTFSDFPRGHSVDEVTSLTTPPDEHGKTITFSFAERNSDCLSKVTFNLE